MRKEQGFKWKALELGTCYYPEQWDEKLWDDDLKRMKENGIFIIRIAEFAWSKFEPKEGEFNFEFFDSFLELAKKNKMKVIFGTPTATPPAWLTNKYPEVLNCSIEGVPFYHGMRRHYNYNSAIYQKLSARIVEKIAEHYGKHPSIIGWQIDNELNCEVDVFYSESDTRAFREYLNARYSDIEALNKAWGTVFWNQTYTDFEEVFVPRNTLQKRTNPHQEFDFIRFVSESAIRFCKMQSDIIRKYCKEGDFITTNGMFGHLDNHKLTDASLDIYTYDSYPNFSYGMNSTPSKSTDLNDRKWSLNLTEVRSVCPHFGIMEQQVGANGWNTWAGSPVPKPGQMMLWAMQSIAHGADFISFFRWRTATKGTEIYWHGILDYDNKDNRKLAEVKKIWNRTKGIEETVGAQVQSVFGLLKEYDNNWDAELDEWNKHIQRSSEKEIFVASQLTHTPMDIVHILDDSDIEGLEKYPVLIYPHPVIEKGPTVNLLKQYVYSGGTLIIGCRAGQKDTTGGCNMESMPGMLAEITGSQVREYTFVHPEESSSTMLFDGEEHDTGIFNDILEPIKDSTKILASYSSNYYNGMPALIESKHGKGKVLHFGGSFTRKFIEKLFTYTGIKSPHNALISLPEECELVVKSKDGEKYLFVLNYAHTEKEIELKQAVINLDTKKRLKGTVVLKAFETKVYKVLD